MDEVRFQKVELQVSDHARILGDHSRRFDDVKGVLDAHGSQLENQHKFIKALQDNTATQKRMIEVGEAVIEALGWAAKAAKWIACIAGAIGTVVAAIKAIKF